MKDDVRAVRLRVGRKVRQLRRLRGLSQEKLAELVGNHEKHIGLVERGQVNVGINILAKIAANLSVDVSELVQPSAGDLRRKRTYTATQPEMEQLDRAARIIDRMKRATG